MIKRFFGWFSITNFIMVWVIIGFCTVALIFVYGLRAFVVGMILMGLVSTLASSNDNKRKAAGIPYGAPLTK